MRFFTYCGIIFLFFYNSVGLRAQQCLGSGFCSGGVQYPSGIFSSNTNSWATVSTLNYAGEYAVYNVTSGSQYEWSLCPADGGSASYDAQLTLINNSTLVNICYSNDQCASNTPKIQWTATFTGNVRVLINQFNCATNSTFTTIVWRCSSCGSGSAPANDNCSGATTLTVYSGSSCGGATTGDVTGATQSIAAEVCSGFTGTANDDVWYKFTTGAGGGNHMITVAGSASFDAVVDLRSGACNGTNVSCADASGSGGTEIINAVLSGSTTYYVRVYDYYSGTPATTTFTICITSPSSCSPYYSTGTSAGDYINRVQLNTIDNTPAGTGSVSGSYYNDYYSTVSTTLQAGTSHTLTVTVGTYGGQTIAAWIDYNQDGDFLDASENLGEVTNIAASASGIINFTLPAGATTGNTRMRVRTVWSDVGIDPCATYSYGETEDYKINITPACTTPGTPVSLSTSGISTSGATLNWAAGTPAGSATVTYYWALGSASNVTYEANYLQRGTTTSLNSGALSGLSPGTTYYWTVKAVTSCDGTVSSYAVAISFTTSCTTPSVPTALNTTNVTTTSALLNWTASASGSPTVSYYWAVGAASNVTYEANYLQRGIATGVSANVFGLTANTTYYWTVKAYTSCNGTVSSYPAAINFTTSSVPTPLITWNGNTNTDWNTTTNWTPNQIPTATDNVVIPAGRTFYPVLTANGLSINNTTTTNRCKSLHIDAGGTVTIFAAATDQYVYCSGVINISGVLNHNPASNSMRFQINSGGTVTVKNGGILNVGSSAVSAGVPGGTTNQFNDLQINDGELKIDPGGKVFIMDDLQITGTAGTKGKLTQSGGDLYIKYYGDGSANSLGFDIWTNAIITISSGNIYLCGQDNGATAKMADWNPNATYSITGGTVYLLNEQTGTLINYPGYCDFKGRAINNLVINRSGATSYLSANVTYPANTINGDITITAGTFDANTQNITTAGNWTNNSSATAFTAGTGSVTFTGSGKTIGGSFGTNFNTLTVNAGASYTINPSGGSWPNNVAQAQGTFTNSGDITIASGKALDLYGATNTLNGTITAASNYDATRDIDLNTTGNVSSSGTINADLRIFSGTSTLTSNFTLNGNFTIRTGAGFTMTTHTFTDNGSWTNDGTFTSGSSSVIFNGSSKSITGASADGATSAFNNFTIQSGASYTFNPTASNWDVNGSFLNSGTLTISSNKFIDVYSATSQSESVVLDGTITTTTVNDGTQDIDINNTVNLSGSGNITADIRIFSNTTTLTSDFTLNGGFELRSGSTFTMSTHNLSVESWKNSGTFTAGTGTVKFIGSGSRTVDANCNYSGSAKATADFYNVIVDRGTDTVSMLNTPMRVANDFTIENGLFSTGWRTNSNGNDGHNRRLTVVKIATIKTGGTFFIGYQRACNNPDENLLTTNADCGFPCGSVTCTTCLSCNPDSLNVPVFLGDVINYGRIKTNRPINSGYQDIKLAGARITGTGAVDEFAVDFQVEDGDTATQVGSVYISGDLIVPSAANSLFINTSPNEILTVAGSLYIYRNFTHNGTVNVYGDITNSSATSDNPILSNAIINVYQLSQNCENIIKFTNPVTMGYLNIKTIGGNGKRRLKQSVSVNNDFTTESGRELWTDNKNITLLGNWTNNGNFYNADNSNTGAKSDRTKTHPGGFISSTAVYQIFDCTSAFTLISVLVYAETSGNRTFFLRNSSGVDLVTPLVVNVPQGRSRVYLNFSVPVGSDLRLGVSDFSGGNLYRDVHKSASLPYYSYPYSLGSVGNVTGAFNSTSIVTDRWYWCYDWEFTDPGISQTVSFTGSSAQSMGGTSATTFYNLTIANTSSTGVTFNNSGAVTNTLTLTDGIIYTTSSKLLTINDQGTASPAGGVAGSYVNGPVKKIGRDGAGGPYSFLFPTGKNNIWARLYMVHFSGITATTDAFTAEYFDDGYGVYTMSSPLLGVSSLEYWNLTKNSGDAGLNKRVRLYSENNSLSQIDAYNQADLTVAHWNSGTSRWEDIGFNPNSSNSGAGTPSGWISSDNTSSFSPFTFASRSSANPLPVELLTFDAKLNGDKVDLFWTTAAEINNDYFTVERSRNMENFEKIITVKGAGNSNVPIDYSAIDDHPVEGTSFYRLKQTDFDGTITYSDAVPITISRTKTHTDNISALKDMLVYPNPGKGLFNINFENNAEGVYQFMVFDITGRRVYSSQKTLEKGSVLVPVDLSELTSGTYILVVQAADSRFSHKLIIQK